MEKTRLALTFPAPGMVRVRFTAEADFAPPRPWDPACLDEDFEPPPLAFTRDVGI